jgi:hypothetical protein
MKEFFTSKNFGDDALDMIGTINGILDDYSSQGYDLSLRQLYYQLVSRNIVPNTERSYKNIGVIVSDARLAGLIDWNMIKDRGRETIKNPHWDNPADFMEAVAPQYRFDLWADQDNYVEVMVEKQALEGVLQPICRGLDIPFTANKGYSSSSAMYEASKRFLQRAEQGKELYVIYLGDHDPSGIDMSRDILDRLNLFIGSAVVTQREDRLYECTPHDPIKVNRIALNMDQIEELNPPENPAKITDSRAAGYIARFGRSSWELDAIEPRQLARLVEAAVKQIMDYPKFIKNQKRQERHRKELLKFAKTYLQETQ